MSDQNTVGFNPSNVTTEEPTAELRWAKDPANSTLTLQQKFFIRYHEDGECVRVETDWRPVPVVDITEEENN